MIFLQIGCELKAENSEMFTGNVFCSLNESVQVYYEDVNSKIITHHMHTSETQTQHC